MFEAIGGARRALKRVFTFALLFSLGVNLLMLVPPIYMMQVFDRVLTTGSFETLVLMTSIAVFCIFIGGMLDLIRSGMLANAAEWLDGKLGAPALRSLFDLSSRPGFKPDRQPVADVEEVRRFVGSPALNALLDAPWIPVYLGVLFIIDPALFAVGAAAAVVLFALAFTTDWATRRRIKQGEEGQARAGRFVSATLGSIDSVAGLGMADSLAARYEDMKRAPSETARIVGVRIGTITSLSKFVRMSVQVAILGLGAYLVISARITPGQMIAASIILGRGLAPIEQSISGWKSFIGARLAWNRLQALARVVGAKPDRSSLALPTGHVTVQGVSFVPRPGETPILRAISFEAQPGEVVCVGGPSGAGKSSLLKLLVGHWAPSTGEIRIDGATFDQWSSPDRGRFMGYLPQDVLLFEGTILDNIRRFTDAPLEKAVEAAQLAGADEMLRRLPQGYDTDIGPGGARLSGGQRQRVGFARAVFGGPSLIVLDEPNSNLDAAGEKALIDCMTALKNDGKTVIVAAHRNAILSVCDKLLWIENGVAVAFGPVQQVLERLKNTRQPHATPVHQPSKTVEPISASMKLA